VCNDDENENYVEYVANFDTNIKGGNLNAVLHAMFVITIQLNPFASLGGFIDSAGRTIITRKARCEGNSLSTHDKTRFHLIRVTSASSVD
jgi:hypothetical protein